jgi:putative transposase
MEYPFQLLSNFSDGGRAMADGTCRISDQLWKQIEPLLPPKPPDPKSGNPYIDKRMAMEGILYMLHTRGDMRDIKAESPLYEYLKEWRRTGVFDRLWQAGILTYDEMRTLVLWGD